jgi:hypothetical protein
MGQRAEAVSKRGDAEVEDLPGAVVAASRLWGLTSRWTTPAPAAASRGGERPTGPEADGIGAIYRAVETASTGAHLGRRRQLAHLLAAAIGGTTAMAMADARVVM